MSPPKSTSASLLSATPRTATTRPRPNASWLTRSPGESDGIGRSPGPATRPRRMARSAATCDGLVSSWPCHSTRSGGMSSRKGEADVGEPTLLGELLWVTERAHVREDAVLEPAEEHDRKLQPLCGVQRHQG